MRNGIECRKRHSLMRNRSITFSVNCPQLNLKKTKYEVYDIYEIEIGDVSGARRSLSPFITIQSMSCQQKKRACIFSFLLQPAWQAQKPEGEREARAKGIPIPHLFSFLNLPPLSTLPRRLFVQLRPKRRTKQPLMCRSKSLAFIRPLTCVDVLVC